VTVQYEVRDGRFSAWGASGRRWVLKEVAVGQKVTGDVLFAWSARRGRRPQLTLGWRLRTVAWGRPARWLHSARIDLHRWLEAVDEKENAAAR
jgi:hypothetical protein